MTRLHSTSLVLTAALAAVLAGCGRSHDKAAPPAPGSAAAPRPWSPDTVATVDGEPITMADVALLRQGGHGGTDATSQAQAVDDIVRERLAADRAHALGLDDDPAFLAELHRLQAPVKAFERGRLAELYYKSLEKQVKVDAAAERAYFDQHADEIRTTVHVWQIIDRDRTAVEKAREAIAGGAEFEDVAKARFPQLPPGRPPWDVGELRWNQIPEAWKPALAKLEVGGVSDVIAGPRDRYWIIKLVDRRKDPSVTFEQVQPVIEGILKTEGAQALRDQADKELRGHAKVVLRAERTGSSSGAAAAPAPATGAPAEP